MKYSKQERLDIGRKIYESGMSYLEAGAAFGISDETARRYQIFYENNSGILHQQCRKNSSQNDESNNTINPQPLSSMCNYIDMSKEELLKELMKVKVREARLKKGYIVKGVGAHKEFVLLNNKNIK